MLAVVLALACAVAYGASDFVAGVTSRRVHYARVGVVSQVGALTMVTLAAVLVGGAVTTAAVGWGALSGLGAGVGTAALYRGFARGQMSVAGPLSGAGSAAIPAVFGLLIGERPSVVTLVGVVLALPAIWLIAGDGGDRGGGLVEGAVEGLLAGAGFGLLFLALSRTADDTGLWPTVAGHLVALVVIAVFVLSTVRRQTPGGRFCWRKVVGAALAGALGGAATVSFLLASRQGLLVVVSVLAALYPGVTVLLARVVLAERSTRRQLVGLVVAAVAVTAITIG